MTRSLQQNEQETTLGAVLGSARSKLARAGIESAALDARLLLGYVTGLTREQMIVDDRREIGAAERRRFDDLVERRTTGEPVAYLIGEKEFHGLRFKVSPLTLIPRPDTETLVETALAFCRALDHPPRILDLGTGSGAILLALLHGCEGASGVGVDRSPGALDVARRNALDLGLQARVRFVEGDWTKGLEGPFDVIVTNPPYITTADMGELMRDVADFEPPGALDGGPDGLDPLRIIARDVKRLFSPPGQFCAEIGLGQAAAAKTILKEAGFAEIECVPDLNGIPRCITALAMP